jgi:hypothetical protein
MLLADDISKRVWTVTPIERQGGLGRLDARRLSGQLADILTHEGGVRGGRGPPRRDRFPARRGRRFRWGAGLRIKQVGPFGVIRDGRVGGIGNLIGLIGLVDFQVDGLQQCPIHQAPA